MLIPLATVMDPCINLQDCKSIRTYFFRIYHLIFFITHRDIEVLCIILYS